MEIKRVTEDFGNRGEMSSWTLYEIEDIMYMIEMVFDECDTELANAGMPALGYKKQPIATMRDHLVILLNYVQHAHPQCYNELDHPLYVGFKNEATQALSEIVLEDITTDNTFEMQKYEEIIDVNGQYYRSSTKRKLTMKDFLGLDAVVPGNGMPVVENVETIGWFTALFRVDYESMGSAVESLDQMLEMYLHSGEFSHKEYHPVGNFVSGLLDVTIIKPFIESIYGKDLITREKLTDFERGMQLVNAAVGAVTFGQGALALNFAEMSGKEIATSLLKTWALEAVSDMSAYTVGYACDELGMPASVTFLASLATGCTVSVKAGKYVFQDANNNIVKQLDPDEMQTFLKELDVDLGDMAWGGGKGTYTTSIDTFECNIRNIADTNGCRNDLPLTQAQIDELVSYAKGLGFPEDKIHIADAVTSSNTGILYDEILLINNDVLPANLPTNNPNSLVSGKGTIAHEIIGHYETALKGTSFRQYDIIDNQLVRNSYNAALDEAQASIRAARFAPDLSFEERSTLIRDGLQRLKTENLKINDVRHLLDITER